MNARFWIWRVTQLIEQRLELLICHGANGMIHHGTERRSHQRLTQCAKFEREHESG